MATNTRYQGAGAEFFLQPPLPVAGPIRLPVLHFSGYGIGRGTQADLDAQALRLPTLDVDQFSQRLAVIVLPQFRAGAFGSSATAGEGTRPMTARASSCSAGLADYYRGEYTGLVPELAAAATDCTLLRARLPRFRQFIGYVQAMCGTDELSREIGSVKDAILSGQSHCFNQAFTKCVSERDPNQVIEIERWARELRRDGHGDVADPTKEHRCLRFELDFDSMMEQHSDVLGEDKVQWKSQSHLATQQNPDPIQRRRGPTPGHRTARLPLRGFHGEREQTCTVTIKPETGSTFTAKALEIDLDTSLGYVVPLPPRLRLHYDTGEPKESVRKVCGQPPSDDTVALGVFKMAYDAAHTAEFDFDSTTLPFGFSVDLDFIGLHAQYAAKVYQTTDFMPPAKGRRAPNATSRRPRPSPFLTSRNEGRAGSARAPSAREAHPTHEFVETRVAAEDLNRRIDAQETHPVPSSVKKLHGLAAHALMTFSCASEAVRAGGGVPSRRSRPDSPH